MRKKILLVGILTVSLLSSVPQAQAEEKEGWPVFDVLKLSSLVSSLVARYQIVPQEIERVAQVKNMIEQIRGVNQAAVAGELGKMVHEVTESVRQETYSNGEPANASILKAAKNSAREGSDKAKKELFALSKDRKSRPSFEEIEKVDKLRRKMQHEVASEVFAKSLYMAVNAPQNMNTYLLKADQAMAKAETLQDSVDANTMMLMVGNLGRINQIALDLAEMKNLLMGAVNRLSLTGYQEPDPKQKWVMGESEFQVEAKDKVNVKFE